MSTIQPINAQYRTSERTVVFKAKGDQTLVISIYNLSQERIFKKRLSSTETGILDHRLLLTTETASSLVEKFVQNNILSKTELPSPSPKGVTIEECLQTTELLISQVKQKIVFEQNSELNKPDFICPLSLDVFKDPMIDDHGHSFERSLIEQHMKTSDKCPISREPIKSLVPNRSLRNIIEEIQKKDSMLILHSIIKSDPDNLAQKNIEMASIHEKAEEYAEAVKAYANAFKYTKDSKAYATIPLLYLKMGQPQQALLAYLYLAQYQLQENKLKEAIQSIENAQKIDFPCLQIPELLVKLYRLAGQKEQALKVALEQAAIFGKKHPQEAIVLYKQALILSPDNVSIYLDLAALLENPQEKAQLILTVACHALRQKDYTHALNLCKEAEACQPNSFIDQLLQIHLLDLQKQKKQNPQIKEKLLAIAHSYEKKNLTSQMVKAYKMLTFIEYHPDYYQKIIEGLKTLQKPKQAIKWTMSWLSILIQNRAWEAAEALAEKFLGSVDYTNTSFYENLEIIYSNWHSHKLSDLWSRLGNDYFQNKQFSQAEKIYQKAFDRFYSFDFAIALANTFSEQNKISQSIKTFDQASMIALQKNNPTDFDLCVYNICQIDPKLEHHNHMQRMQLLTNNQIFKLQAEVNKLQEKLSQPTFKEVEIKIQEKPTLEVEKKPELKVSDIPIAFGKDLWATHLGDIGIEPPLPPNIKEILNAPCPFFPGKKVEETHLLVLIPKTVNGKPLTMQTLGELVQKPR